jgi:ubiquinone/menaquinone biosynthesis C-methylase UbiE
MQPICFDAAFLVAMNQYRQSEHAQRRFRRYLELLNPLPGQHILDLGCGSGDFCRALAPYVTPGGHITGVDLAPDAIDLAARLAATPDESLFTFEQGDGHHLHYADGSFDAAVCIRAAGGQRRRRHPLLQRPGSGAGSAGPAGNCRPWP